MNRGISNNRDIYRDWKKKRKTENFRFQINQNGKFENIKYIFFLNFFHKIVIMFNRIPKGRVKDSRNHKVEIFVNSSISKQSTKVMFFCQIYG